MKNYSLYIHIPFCLRKCLFCSFVVSVGQEHRGDDYVSALLVEARAHRGKHIKTVYLGGGTPSMLSGAQLTRLLEGVRANFIIAPKAELSIEANPEGITLEKARCLRELGFNRISLGVQSLDERYLKFLGRAHDRQRAIDAYGILREAGIDNINLDLMYGFPNQTLEELEADVRGIASLGSEHLSLYTLTVEPNSRFYAKQMKLDDNEKLAEHFMLVGRLLAEYGFMQYEISNFAKEGFESAHNTNYWLGGEYLGLGVGAHGYLEGRRYWNADKLADYFDAINKEGCAVDGYEDLSEDTRLMEKIIFGLRMNRGIDAAMVPSGKENIIAQLVADGFLARHNGVLRATAQGRLVLDEISTRLI